MLKWAIELGQFDLEYRSRTAIKGQALADFILEFPPDMEGYDKAIVVENTSSQVNPFPQEGEISELWWTMCVDGAVNSDGAGAGIVLISPEGHRVISAIHFAFKVTNNDVEYEALIAGMKLSLEMKVRHLRAQSDSMLVVYQINGGWQAMGPKTGVIFKVCSGDDQKICRSKNGENPMEREHGGRRTG